MSYSEIDAGSVIANRGLNGLYGYGGQGNFLGDGSAVKESVRGNRDISLLNSVNEGVRDQFLGNQIDRGHSAIQNSINTSNQFLSDRIWSQGIDAKFAAVTAQFASQERQMFASQLDQQRANADIAKSIAEVKCCCEANSAKIESVAALSAKDLQIQTLALELAACRNADSGRGNSGQGNS